MHMIIHLYQLAMFAMQMAFTLATISVLSVYTQLAVVALGHETALIGCCIVLTATATTAFYTHTHNPQDLVVEELVCMTDALTRETNLEIVKRLRSASTGFTPLAAVRALAELPFNPLLAPLQLTSRLQLYALDRIATRLEVALELTPDDQETLRTLRRLVEIFRGSSSSSSSSSTSSGTQLLAANGAPLRRITRFSDSHAGHAAAGGVSTASSGSSSSGGSPLSSLFRGPSSLAEAAETARSVQRLLTIIGPGARGMLERFVVQLTTRQVSLLLLYVVPLLLSLLTSLR
jgi:hypothetical protein